MTGGKGFEQVRPYLQSIATGLAEQFGPNCEVAVHDVTHGVENTLSIIKNGHVTGRKVGDGASEAVLEALRNNDVKDRYGYIINAKNGKMLKSTTVHIRDTENNIIAVFCINYDISDFILANRSLQEFCSVADKGETEAIPSNVSELLGQMIEESHRICGKPVSAMSKEEKAEAIRFLDSKGALLIKKSSERISEYYGISKFTLYNYLGETSE
ncbi:MAG: helix-turn-helix transcriptional regulator [Coriobacteriales bacterium]|jgi:predicted transcriptional regulator YheO|nr:helix-turn-helix transcriptional regulator [Coriobacteriales bacterium]